MLIHWQNSSTSRSVRLFTACLSLSALLPLIALQIAVAIDYCPQAQAFGKKKIDQPDEAPEKAEKAEKPEKVKKISKEEAAEQEALEKEYAELQA